MTSIPRSFRKLALLAIGAMLLAHPAHAGFINQLPADVTNFAILNSGAGNVKVNLSDYGITGNIGIGAPSGSTKTSFAPAGGCSGPCNLFGNVQFASTVDTAISGSNHITGTITGNHANVQTDLNASYALSTALSGEAGKLIGINLNSGQSAAINASDGILDASGNRVFDVTSVSFKAGSTLTLTGDAAGDSVVLNFSSAVQLNGAIKLNGLSPDQVLFNVSGNHSLKVNANGATLSGIFLDPEGIFSFKDAVINGRILGGGSHALALAAGVSLTAPPATRAPEPATLAVLAAGLCALTIIRRRHPSGHRR